MAANKVTYGSTAYPSSDGHILMPEIAVSVSPLSEPGAIPSSFRRTVLLNFLIKGSISEQASAFSTLTSTFSAGGSALILKDASDNALVNILPTTGVLVSGQPWVVSPPFCAEILGTEWSGASHVTVSLAGDYTLTPGTGSNSSGSYTTTTTLTNDGNYIVTISGSYRGTDAATVVAALKLTSNYSTLDETTSVNTTTGEVAFRFSYLQTNTGRAVVEWSETITSRAIQTQTVVKPLIGTGFASQDVSQIPGSIQQSGYAVGLTGYVSPPSACCSGYAYAHDLGSGQSSPRRHGDGTYSHYRSHWNYLYVFTSSVPAASPSLPPS